MDRWHYERDGTRYGPVSDAELRRVALAGGLRPTDLVWRTGLSDWVPACRVSGLFPPEPPPPLPRRSTEATLNPSTGSIHRWEMWEIWVYMIVTLGFFALYLAPSCAGAVERITVKRRMPFGALLTLGIFTLGIALSVAAIVYAFPLARHGERNGQPGSNQRLGAWVLALTLATVVLGFVVVGFFLGWLVFAPLSMWLIQSEINLYADDFPRTNQHISRAS